MPDGGLKLQSARCRAASLARGESAVSKAESVALRFSNFCCDDQRDGSKQLLPSLFIRGRASGDIGQNVYPGLQRVYRSSGVEKGAHPRQEQGLGISVLL